MRDPPRARALSRCGICLYRPRKRPWVWHEARCARADRPVQATVTRATAARRGLSRKQARALPAHRPASAVPVGSRGEEGQFGHLAQLMTPREMEFRRSLPVFRRCRQEYEATRRHLQRVRCETPTTRRILALSATSRRAEPLQRGRRPPQSRSRRHGMRARRPFECRARRARATEACRVIAAQAPAPGENPFEEEPDRGVKNPR